MQSTIATVSDADFKLPRPRVIGENLIPENIRRAMSPGWDTGEFKHRPIRIIELNDVFVVGEGLVVDREGQPVKETTAQYTPNQISSALAVLDRMKRQAITIEPRTLLARKRGDHNYGHWLIECLPKIGVSLEAGVNPDLIAVPANAAAMQAVIETSLQLTGLSWLPTRVETNETPTHYKNLLVVDGLTSHGTYMSPRSLLPMEEMRATQPGSGVKRVFVRRTGIARCISNEAELEVALAALGFISVDPSAMNLRQQVAMFKDADVIIGAMGAAMTNIAFAHRGALVINLAPAVMPDTFFYFLATHRKQRYVEVRCKIDSPDKGRASNFHVPVETMLEALHENLSELWNL